MEEVAACFLTREPIVGEPFILSAGGVRLKTTSPEGYFKTGLSVNVIFDVPKKFGAAPSIVVRMFAERPPKQMFPTSGVFCHKVGRFQIFRRFFRSSSQMFMGRRLQPANFYIEFTGNNSTGTAYHIMFETPEGLWEKDRDIATIMIERRVLDEHV